ncbi:Low density lipoprotein receptor adapter protein 1 [Eumeta japonica]|uniref:Low density lipoprotein receptor adapter protein 1 n=1 Tax=Eumeta variegata TaxID=151549 RepID=A0A4C1UUM8_EUMVA|nr:Low density lipoprotein receptor adapter protein 1 [Eumeta japonica]
METPSARDCHRESRENVGTAGSSSGTPGGAGIAPVGGQSGHSSARGTKIGDFFYGILTYETSELKIAPTKRWSPPLMDICKCKGVTSALPASGNRMSDGGEGLMERECGDGRRESIAINLIHRTKCNSGNCYFTSVFRESIVSHGSNWPISVPQPITHIRPYHSKKLSEEWALADYEEEGWWRAGVRGLEAVRYAGAAPVERAASAPATAQAVRAALAAHKGNNKKLQRVNLDISPKGVVVSDADTQEDVVKISIYK